jgi:hypothetical protein
MATASCAPAACAYGDRTLAMPRAVGRQKATGWAPTRLATVASSHSEARVNSAMSQFPSDLFNRISNSNLNLVQIHFNLVQTQKFDQVATKLEISSGVSEINLLIQINLINSFVNYA